MNPELLDDAEREERNRTPFPRIIRYYRLAEAFHWDEATVDAQREEYLSDMFSCFQENNHALRVEAKRKPAKERDSERPWYDGLSHAQIRARLGVSDDMPDEIVDEMIGRETDEEE